MPEVRYFRGREVRKTRMVIESDGRKYIHITLEGKKSHPGKHLKVTPEEYDRDLVREFK